MGWSSAGSTIFDPVARSVIEAGVSDDAKRTILGKLIEKLREGDWDTEDESLEEFTRDPVIVALFREYGVTMDCNAGEGTPGELPCVRRLGHKGDHVDKNDDSWSQATPPDVPA